MWSCNERACGLQELVAYKNYTAANKAFVRLRMRLAAAEARAADGSFPAEDIAGLRDRLKYAETERERLRGTDRRRWIREGGDLPW